MNILIAALALASAGMTPAECVAVASKDLATIPPTVQPYIRYLTLGEFDRADRVEKAKVLSGHVNHLSTEQDLQPVAVVDGSDSAVLRINLNDYGWSPELWEKLAEVDPYFHVVVIEDWPGGVWNGKHYPAGPYKVHALAPWLSEAPSSPAMLSAIVEATHSQVPIVRGDWFLNQSAIQALRRVGYYDFLRVKSQKDFDDLAGFDRKIADRASRIDRESVGMSGVTLQPRAIIREEGVRPVWRTFDFELAVDGKDPLRIIGKDIEKAFDATEQFALLRNGLWATALFNGKGERQDFAPPQIASDKQSKSNDARVHVNQSCLRCHVDGGLQAVDGWFRHGGQPVVKSFDEVKARQFRQQYQSDLKRYLDRDRAVYADAVKEVTGWTPKAWSAAYAAEWERYEDARVDLEWAARDLHTTLPNLKRVMTVALRAELAIRDQQQHGNTLKVEIAPTIDLVFGQLLAGKAVGIRQWEAIYPSASATIRGLVP